MSKLEDAVDRLSELSEKAIMETDEKVLASYATEMAQCWLLYTTWVIQNLMETTEAGNVDVKATVETWRDKSVLDFLDKVNGTGDNI